MQNIAFNKDTPILLTNKYNDDISLDNVITKKQEDEMYLIEDFFTDWINYELSLCEKTDENPNPLSQKTIDGYHKVLSTYIEPVLKNNKLLYFRQITTDVMNNILKDIKGYHSKRNTYIVFSLLFQYAILKKKIRKSDNPFDDVKKPIKPKATIEKEIRCIETEKQHIYSDMFEKENTDMSILLETILLTGLRPEEACGLKWKCFDLEKKMLIINNAYKSFNIYNEKGKVIGHYRSDATLKTPESYRTVPMCPRLIEILLKHRENQKQRFKTYRKFKNEGRKWSEDDYMFLGRTYKPYVSDTLSSAFPELCDKYKLEKFYPYDLRHSFATFCYEKGMKELVLMKILGHSSFETTHKYYVNVSKKIKEREMQEVFNDVFYKRAS